MKQEVAATDKQIEFLSILEHFKAHVNGIVTLATGALVLSATFLKDIPLTTKQYEWWLKLSWMLLSISIVSGVSYSYVLTMLVNNRDCWPRDNCAHRSWLMWLNLFLHLSFLLAIIAFMVFALLSI
jgi:hypothetical protein